jgi:hypothetical protein
MKNICRKRRSALSFKDAKATNEILGLSGEAAIVIGDAIVRLH